jgi:hypothetical protein
MGIFAKQVATFRKKALLRKLGHRVSALLVGLFDSFAECGLRK